MTEREPAPPELSEPAPPELLEDSGGGYPLLLVHHLGFDGRQWNPQITEFGRRYRMLRVEWNYTRIQASGGWTEHFISQGAKLSIGKGKVPEQRFVDPAGDLLALMDCHGIPYAHVVVSGDTFGDSMIELALEHPERIRSLIVDAWVSGIRFSRPGTDYADVISRGFREYEELFAHGDIGRYVDFEIENGKFQVDRGPGRHLTREMLLDNISICSPPLVSTRSPVTPVYERLGEVRTPVLAVSGQQAWNWRKEGLEYLASHVPGARNAVIPDARLYPNLDNPDSFNQQVLSFLADVDARLAT